MTHREDAGFAGGPAAQAPHAQMRTATAIVSTKREPNADLLLRNFRSGRIPDSCRIELQNV
jgi:hypothetical protein